METALTGQDTIQIQGRVLTGFGDGDVGTLVHPNDKMALKVGKNGNSVYAYNATGRQVDLTLRVLRGSRDDKFLNSLNLLLDADPSRFVLMTGKFVKRIGNGLGRVTYDTYLCIGGVFTKNVDATSNVEGATDQALAVYNIKFSNGARALF